MANSNSGESVDPVYKYIDDKIKPIKARLDKLAVAHDAVAAEQTKVATNLMEEILRTQRFLAYVWVGARSQLYRNLLDTSHIANKIAATNQLVSDTSRTNTRIRASKDPITIASQFEKEWDKHMGKLGFPQTLV